MQIYVACLASYNAGVLHGEWIDLEGRDADDVGGEIARILRESPHPNVTVACPDCAGVTFPVTRTTCTKCGATADYEAGSPPDYTRCHSCAAVSFGCRTKELICKCVTCNGTGKVPSAEEWAVHDYDDVFGDTWGEHPNLDKLCALQERLDELHDDTERAAYTAFCDHEGRDDVTVEQFREAYVGQFDTWADFAENYVDETGLLHDVPDTLSRYFDYERYGRDMRLNGDAFAVSGFYFWSH
ncbi:MULTISPECIES: antirestriction protein ArdA [Stenotrophomonas]|uniref:antirestriction protein ArdA n=1 Tax=Stenotrophomonas TaxID=40323 RepID=UPI0012387390|nr:MULTISPECIES: antirestriction protein ArdA [Stenotrophomonas]QEU33463.1 antirestriction protein ArdA [Stenotrophomonas maltophilia]